MIMRVFALSESSDAVVFPAQHDIAHSTIVVGLACLEDFDVPGTHVLPVLSQSEIELLQSAKNDNGFARGLAMTKAENDIDGI